MRIEHWKQAARRGLNWLGDVFLVRPPAVQSPPSAPKARRVFRSADEMLASEPASAADLRMAALQPARVSPWLLWLALPLYAVAVTVPLELWQQAAVGGALWLAAMLVRVLRGSVANLLLISLTLVASGRYLFWRVTHTLDMVPGLEMLLAWALLAAEMYAWIILMLGFVQTAYPLKRERVELPQDRDLWPHVDVFIPTYCEPMDIVKPTVLAARGMDWPHDKLHVHLLDDGDRTEFRQFAQSLAIGYQGRRNGEYAKAGNLNAALANTFGEFILVLDCDHVPVKSFLTVCMGNLLADPNCALVQTPHHFFSPDPIERNLGTYHRVPSEGHLFYGLIQKGNDLWNASFFCGSCGVLRRSALEDVGGFATETVTEDVHTSLRLHRKGYSSCYIAVPQAAGLATENLAAHIRQRHRWARGMASVFRIDNPLLGRGLSLAQRLCYLGAMLHFFHGLPRLVFLTAPLAYLFMGWNLFSAPALLIVVYALPYLAVASLTNARIQSRFRHSFWSEVYETLLAWRLSMAAYGSLFKLGSDSFNVTVKGERVEKTHFDWHITLQYLFLIAANLAGVAFGIWHVYIWPEAEVGATVLNLLWVSANLVVLGAAVGVAEEASQVRKAPRVLARVAVMLRSPDGELLRGHTLDYSSRGLRIELAGPSSGPLVGMLQLDFPVEPEREWIPAQIVGLRDGKIALSFDGLSTAQETRLIQNTFGRSQSWLDWAAHEAQDRPMVSLLEVFQVGLRGYKHLGALVFRRLTARRFENKQATHV